MSNGQIRFIDQVRASLEEIVEKSFNEDRARATMSEVKNRITIVLELTKLLRNEYGWSRQKIIDKVPYYLRCTLDREPFDPGRELNIWIPPTSNNV